MDRASRLRPSGDNAGIKTALRTLARRVRNLDQELKDLDALIKDLIDEMAPQLLDEVGISYTTATQILLSWSHQGRCHSEAAFARLAGVAPIPASSGQTTRHRLSRGGDRQLNKALHLIVVTRCRVDPDTRAYIERRIAEGKTRREARRCLKRYVARHIFRILENPPTPLDNT